ncbi:MAG TPA: hypothetical protein VL485_16640 [Ktedonobacteraceae bacterium]|jgi:2-polyprenyl-6-methoxyphenol hydroxylase-like FAD-dependent oxidoreductase|nr:hypothetical protein [Ktedonobacteraceae bacterium]
MDLANAMTQQQQSGRQHALVIGASMAGLLAARVLSDYFEQVTVIERDPLSDDARIRKSVPQGQHTHILLHKGVEIINNLFPDLYPSLEADGAQPIDAINDFYWFHFGVWKLRFNGSMRIYGQTRPLLEYHVRRCVAARPNVRIIDTAEVLGIVDDTKNHAGIIGARVRIRNRANGEGYLETNLIVDASGRGSQTPRWLTELGYPPIDETQIKIGVGYASRIYRRPANFHPKVFGLYPWPVDRTRYGYLIPIEGNAFSVTLSGYLPDHPPADEAGFLEFARGLSQPDIYEILKVSEPLGPITLFKYPVNKRRHYEHSTLPNGLVVLGDAVCGFNPINAQGMTIAALGAQTLLNCLEQQSRRGTMAGFPSRFQKALGKVVDVPWLLTKTEDFRHPEVEGKRSFDLTMLQNYVQRVGYLTATHPFVAQTFYEVLHMQKPPSALFHPRILLPALFAHQSVETAPG